ncbi:MAG: radical SAM family heme chaperone HemW [Flavisolibacter sp.]
MAGIYLHIPFCKQACTYCNFHFTTSLRYKDPLVEALVREAEQESPYLGSETIRTVYFGGGTPSLLDPGDIHRLVRTIGKHYDLAPEAEITLEANPDDISAEKLQGWKAAGINRLSLGVQSFFEEELRWMNRAHHAQQALDSLDLAVSFFPNTSLDLIYGSPLLTDDMWKQNVERVTERGIPHLSCYALTVEERTPLSKSIQHRKTEAVDPEKQARQFLQLMDWLKEKGYEHYEVSNFALPGHRSRHNSSYWQGQKYLGLGPSAHSYNGRERRWNIANNQLYIEGLEKGTAIWESEVLSVKDRLNETVMISLRTREGLDLNRIEKEFSFEERTRIEKRLERYVKGGWIQMEKTRAALTDEGMLRADGIAADLFV